jgi:putative ABC transport system permease protein
MNYFAFILKSATDDFGRNKMRTALASLGILIGIASVVLLMSLGLGLKKYIAQQFESLGTGLIYVMPGDIKSGGMTGAVGGIKFDDKDVTTLKRVPNVSFVLPFVVKYTKAEASGQSKTVELAGSTTDVFAGMNVDIAYGSQFSKSDQDRGNKRVVLGPKLAEKLFGAADNAVGKIIKLDGQAFTVCGVAKPKGGGGLGVPSIDDHVWLPYKAAYSLTQDKKFYAIYLKANSDENINAAKDEAKRLLLKRYKADDFSVIESTELLNTINQIFSVLNTVLIAIAAISLIVGGIGIMNIMYVSVVERIREIGIRRAIGATGKDILWQFLAESVLLSFLGGVLGLTLSYIVVLIIQTQFPAYIDLMSVSLAVGVSSTIGIIFGVFPAKKAADLSPMEAIRYE